MIDRATIIDADDGNASETNGEPLFSSGRRSPGGGSAELSEPEKAATAT